MELWLQWHLAVSGSRGGRLCHATHQPGSGGFDGRGAITALCWLGIKSSSRRGLSLLCATASWHGELVEAAGSLQTLSERLYAGNLVGVEAWNLPLRL